MDPAFFTVHAPRARMHQQQLACMHERTGVHEPVCMLAVAAAAGNGWLLLLLGCCCWLLRSQQQQVPAAAT